MSSHPILTLVQDHDVKQAKGFRAAAERITGASLEADYQAEIRRLLASIRDLELEEMRAA